MKCKITFAKVALAGVLKNGTILRFHRMSLYKSTKLSDSLCITNLMFKQKKVFETRTFQLYMTKVLYFYSYSTVKMIH